MSHRCSANPGNDQNVKAVRKQEPKMLDAFALLSSGLCVVYVIWRAMLLDRTLPWFEREAGLDRQSPAKRGDSIRTNSPRL